MNDSRAACIHIEMCRVCLWHMTENRCSRWWWLDLHRSMYLRECETKTTETVFRFYPTSYTCTLTRTSRHCVMLKSLCASEYYLITTVIIPRDRELLIAHICRVLSFSLPHFFTIKLCRHMSHARLHAHAHVYTWEAHICAMMIGHTHLKFIHHNFPVERSF